MVERPVDEPGLAVADGFANPTSVGHDDRQPAGHCLDADDAERLEGGRVDEDITGGDERRHIGTHAQKVDAIGDAQLLGETLEPGGVAAVVGTHQVQHQLAIRRGGQGEGQACANLLPLGPRTQARSCAHDVQGQGQAGEQHYFIMEYVDGDTVLDRMQAKKRLPEKEALAIIRQVALALEHAHERGFVHRDIKPKNLMVTSTGVVKLADLGLARAMGDQEAAAAETGKAFGTPYYISPEQIRGLPDIGPPADIYGLGATLYHMLTGKVPFEGKNPNEVMQRHSRMPWSRRTTSCPASRTGAPISSR